MNHGCLTTSVFFLPSSEIHVGALIGGRNMCVSEPGSDSDSISVLDLFTFKTRARQSKNEGTFLDWQRLGLVSFAKSVIRCYYSVSNSTHQEFSNWCYFVSVFMYGKKFVPEAEILFSIRWAVVLCEYYFLLKIQTLTLETFSARKNAELDH